MLPQNTVEILKKLNKTQLKSLGDFIHSPYFNSIDKLKDLYNEIMKSYPDFSNKRLEDKSLYKKFYPGKEFNKKVILNLFSDFGNLLKKFLAYEKFGLQDDAIEVKLAESLSDIKCYELSKKVINDYKKKKKSDSAFNEDYFYHLYKMDKVYYTNLIHSRPIYKEQIYETYNTCSDSLMLDFLNKYSALAHSQALTSIIRSDEKNNKIIESFLNTFEPEKFLKYVDNSDDKHAQAVKLQYLLYYYTKSKMNEEQYFELKKLLLDNVKNFSPADTCIYFKTITDVAVLNKIHFEEVFDLRKTFCELKIYPNDSIPKFSAATLQNTFITAMGLYHYEWAENFLDEYINYIDEDLKENEYNYSKGLLNFQLKKYETSLEFLNKVKYSGLVEKVNVRFYYVMNYIELKLYDAAASMLKSIKQLVRESKDIPEVTSISIKDALKFFNEIIKCYHSLSKLDLAVYKEAKNAKSFFYQYYIVEKMEGMI